MGAERTVLVTGGAGGLGAALIPALQTDGWRVRALIHRRPVDGADEQVEGSLSDCASLEAATAGVGAVLHMAAVTHARRRADYERINIEGTRNLVDAAASASVSRFVLVSSRTAVAGAGAYGESKLAGEEILHESGLPYVILRPAEVYGAGAKEGIDELIDRARRGAPIPIVGRGADQICPVHLDELVPAMVASMSTPVALGKTYILGGACMSMREVAEAAVRASGSNSRIVRVPVHIVALAARASSVLPIPLYPDQLARLRADKPGPSPDAASDLGFAAASITGQNVAESFI